MPTFRKGGSATVLFFDGSIPDPGSPEFQEALSKERFRTIENAASEETSAGWVTPDDPSGDSFDGESMDVGHACWLRIRIDKKALPRPWVQIHRAAAERAAGRKLSAAEVRDLKADLMETLLPRVLPSVSQVDVLVAPRAKKVVVMSTSASAVEAVGKAFFNSFAVPLEPADPYRMALASSPSSDQMRALDFATPVPWPSVGGDGPTQRLPGSEERSDRAEHGHDDVPEEMVG